MNHFSYLAFRQCKYFFAFIISLFIVFNGYSQKSRDVVFLKSGSIIEGTIIDIDSLNQLKIKTPGGKYLIFDKEKVRKYKIRSDNTDTTYFKSPQVRKNGYINITQMGVLFGRDKETSFKDAENYSHFTLETFNGYKIKQIAIGATAGMDLYKEGTLFPLGASLRTKFLTTDISPVAFATVGHSFEFFSKKSDRQDFTGGTFWSTGLGLSVNTGNKSSFVISLSYKHQKARLKSEGWIWEGMRSYTTDNKTFRRFAITMGVNF